MPAVFISDFDFVWTVDARKKKKKKEEDGEIGVFSKHEKYRYHIARLSILW